MGAADFLTADSSKDFKYFIEGFDGIVIIKRVRYSMLDWSCVKQWIQDNKDGIERVVIDGALGEDCSGLFEGCHKLREVLCTTNVSTRYVTNMERMFAGCINIRKINTEDWVLDNVTNSKDIFKDCDLANNKYLLPLLKSLDLVEL